MPDPAGAVPVIVLNWNGWDDTFRCLESLRAAGAGALVWLVDNASREDRMEEVGARFEEVRRLRWGMNLGYAGGNNRALRLAAAEGFRYAYLLNNDCEVKPGFLHQAMAVAEGEHLGAVGSRVAYGDPPGFVQYDGTGHDPGATPLVAAEGSWPADYALGAGMLMNLQACAEVGFFDERFFCYHEEIEWCHRIRRAGWGIRVAAESLVLHYCAGSDSGANALYYQIRNEFLLERCLGADPRDTARRLVYRGVIQAARAAGDARADRWQAVAAGLWDGLHGRFGRRSSPPPAAALRARMAWWTAGAMIRDKWRTLRGLTPGYG